MKRVIAILAIAWLRVIHLPVVPFGAYPDVNNFVWFFAESVMWVLASLEIHDRYKGKWWSRYLVTLAILGVADEIAKPFRTGGYWNYWIYAVSLIIIIYDVKNRRNPTRAIS